MDQMQIEEPGNKTRRGDMSIEAAAGDQCDTKYQGIRARWATPLRGHEHDVVGYEMHQRQVHISTAGSRVQSWGPWAASETPMRTANAAKRVNGSLVYRPSRLFDFIMRIHRTRTFVFAEYPQERGTRGGVREYRARQLKERGTRALRNAYDVFVRYARNNNARNGDDVDLGRSTGSLWSVARRQVRHEYVQYSRKGPEPNEYRPTRSKSNKGVLENMRGKVPARGQ
ncbi:hypothetical protein B0H13DRAFT_1882017 [Mycena leptocephala]|nr:hypothetical protein B0H13DRAFT_1882017 [Mycena leptocephala]